jgi:lipopolysaccharide-induced tumor necrosis factor-alpha factor
MEQQPYGNGFANDKAQYTTAAQALPQYTASAQALPQQQQQQQLPTQPRQGNNYLSATPIASLQQFPAPADCPVCGVREMTITNPETGGYTQ